MFFSLFDISQIILSRADVIQLELVVLMLSNWFLVILILSKSVVVVLTSPKLFLVVPILSNSF